MCSVEWCLSIGGSLVMQFLEPCCFQVICGAIAFVVSFACNPEARQDIRENCKECHIYGYTVLTRNDKQKDRVEISPEEQSAASTEAEVCCCCCCCRRCVVVVVVVLLLFLHDQA